MEYGVVLTLHTVVLVRSTSTIGSAGFLRLCRLYGYYRVVLVLYVLVGVQVPSTPVLEYGVLGTPVLGYGLLLRSTYAVVT
jgi:hypothetical protein